MFLILSSGNLAGYQSHLSLQTQAFHLPTASYPRQAQNPTLCPSPNPTSLDGKGSFRDATGSCCVADQGELRLRSLHKGRGGSQPREVSWRGRGNELSLPPSFSSLCPFALLCFSSLSKDSPLPLKTVPLVCQEEC